MSEIGELRASLNAALADLEALATNNNAWVPRRELDAALARAEEAEAALDTEKAYYKSAMDALGRAEARVEEVERELAEKRVRLDDRADAIDIAEARAESAEAEVERLEARLLAEDVAAGNLRTERDKLEALAAGQAATIERVREWAELNPFDDQTALTIGSMKRVVLSILNPKESEHE